MIPNDLNRVPLLYCGRLVIRVGEDICVEEATNAQ